MKKVIITGTTSYIGTHLQTWLNHLDGQFQVDCLSVRDDSWRTHDFADVDCVVHVAGIAHRKETADNQALYDTVNYKLTIALAEYVKKQGVESFIYLSSMSVFGLVEGRITPTTPLQPVNAYGRSKKKAEEALEKLQSDEFMVMIVRPPMVYGKGCRGNYQSLARLAKITPLFPAVDNRRSMIYIDNLSQFLTYLIRHPAAGVYHPQNRDYVNTSKMVTSIATEHRRKIWLIKFLNPILSRLKISVIRKVFGTLIYSEEMSSFDIPYQVASFIQSIRATESN